MVGLSPFYFQRLFKRLVKKPVNEYIRPRRLANAVSELNSDGRRIVDISLDFGFSSHASFTRAFKEAYGVTPESGTPIFIRYVAEKTRLGYSGFFRGKIL
ncbi:MAG: helix-turn-helix transcriptional regulator [Clostridiales bacterium]|jgi:AraC family transcriptional regulator|nr:helix-turn-helix transcriptional regulator [Clostridiales bacterium]